jgi:hypothetical protein
MVAPFWIVAPSCNNSQEALTSSIYLPQDGHWSLQRHAYPELGDRSWAAITGTAPGRLQATFVKRLEPCGNGQGGERRNRDGSQTCGGTVPTLVGQRHYPFL